MKGIRLRAELRLSKKVLPLFFRNRLMSAFKSLQGIEVYSNRLPRPFSFFLGFDGELRGDKFILEEPQARLYVSFVERDLGEQFASKLLSLKDFPIEKDLYMSVSSIKSLEIKKIDSKTTFKILSPVLIENRQDKPVLPWDDNFEQEFNWLHRRIFSMLGYEYQDVKLRFDFWKKVVVKHTLRGFRESSGKSLMYLTGFVGRFQLEGDPQSLKLLYLRGWGNRTGEGFGFVDVL